MKTPGGARILITGSTGTLGHHVLAGVLALKNAQVLALTRPSTQPTVRARNLRYRAVDFNQPTALAAAFRQFRPTAVIHCAAGGMIYPQVHWFQLIRFNVEATLRLFEQAAGQPGCHFLHVSTGLAYRYTGASLNETDALESIHPYGASKAAADILLRSAAIQSATPLTVFRPFSFTGVHDNRSRLFPSILRVAAEGRPMDLSPGDQVRDFCSARDIARGVVLALKHTPDPRAPAVFNLGSGRALTLRALVEEVVAETALPVQLRFGAHGYGTFEPRHLVADIAHARQVLAWRPTHRLSHAVWELAQASFPMLRLRRPPSRAAA
jgi:nucleoside-diphosphate-sugar epimerase